MLRTGILNPQLNSLLSRIRHTNTLVIADRGFPFWPQIETVDISLVDDLPTVLNVLQAIAANFVIGKAWMAAEFKEHNTTELVEKFERILPPVVFEPHIDFKRRVPGAIGLVRSAGTAPYSNVILESA
ncbi:RbsD/FucU domain-containing protein [Granulicella sp. S190]|uniref:RbsD/FucU domain-containing protein n=1 Tax=Granulicella sp. S190 TaxID=1747226 RepID=UPI00131E7657|nr:RbsD/FucU family protein [Granulicella sp. S190]